MSKLTERVQKLCAMVEECRIELNALHSDLECEGFDAATRDFVHDAELHLLRASTVMDSAKYAAEDAAVSTGEEGE